MKRKIITSKIADPAFEAIAAFIEVALISHADGDKAKGDFAYRFKGFLEKCAGNSPDMTAG